MTLGFCSPFFTSCSEWKLWGRPRGECWACTVSQTTVAKSGLWAFQEADLGKEPVILS